MLLLIREELSYPFMRFFLLGLKLLIVHQEVFNLFVSLYHCLIENFFVFLKLFDRSFHLFELFLAFGQFFVAFIDGLIMFLFFLLDFKILENNFLLELLVCKLSNLEFLQLFSNSLGELCCVLSENLPHSNFRSFLQDFSFPFGVLYSGLAPYEVCYFNVAFLEAKSVNANDIAIRLTVAFTIWYLVVGLLIVLKPAFTRDKRMAFAFSAVVPRFSISL